MRYRTMWAIWAVCSVGAIALTGKWPESKQSVPNPPDTAGFWQQANTAKQIECRDLVLAEVLRMKLPVEAYTDPALATAMQQGFEMCLLKNKVMI